jgi:hypothetical protein
MHMCIRASVHPFFLRGVSSVERYKRYIGTNPVVMRVFAYHFLYRCPAFSRFGPGMGPKRLGRCRSFP